MTRVTRAPVRPASEAAQIMERFAIAVALVDHEALQALLTDDVRWQQIGRQPVVGARSVVAILDRFGPATSIALHHVIADGHTGAVDGEVVLGKTRGFCHTVELDDDGRRVRAFTTYLVVAA